jgi:peptidoglycan/xylan/chitin deacetylase (PgdA/CDA1 family)
MPAARRLLLPLAAGATLAAVAVSGATGAPAPVTIVQEQRTSGPLDLASATLVQRAGELQLTIVTRGDWTPALLAAAPGRRLCFSVATAAQPPTEACIVAARGGVGLRIAHHVTAVRATRPDARTITLRVSPDLLGLAPGRFSWQLSSTWTSGDGCPPAAAPGAAPAPGGCVDTLPATGPASYELIATRPIGCRRSGPALRQRGPRGRRIVALTFDDGPWSDTPQFVSVLEHEHVPARFFVIGGQVAGHGALLRRELADGDVIGNHTFTHPVLTRSGGVARQLSRTTAAIQRAVGFRPCLFRPPYGAYNRSVVATAQGDNMSTITWDVDPRDWARPGTGAIVSRVLAQVRNGSIVLMHDGGGPRGQTLAALPQIIHALKARGYGFVTVADLLGYRLRFA